jgi:hypothetical protein
MTVDHILFNSHKFIPDTQIVSDYIDTRLIGKTITYSKYSVGWIEVINGRVLEGFNESTIDWTLPSDITYVASTGKITGILTGKSNGTYYCVDFDQNMGSIYQALIKTSDIMKQNMSGNGL